MANAKQDSEVLVLVSEQAGITVIPRPTALTRLHYFDGKYLRADDLSKEQAYLSSLVRLSNQAGGFGVVHGFDAALSAAGDALVVGSGLAIDPGGRVLLLPSTETSLDIEKLIAASAASTQFKATGVGGAGSGSFGDCTVVEAAPTAPTETPVGSAVYVITVGYAEAYCGEEDVFGKICEEACAKSTDRPFTIGGVVFRALPLDLKTPLATSQEVSLGQKHLRSLLASAYFEDERKSVESLISGAGLKSSSWCRGAQQLTGTDVAIALLARSGSTSLFLDPWAVRRERMEAAPRRYWAFRMAMRPWNVFLAQVLEFQCQLSELLKGLIGPDGAPPRDPCAEALQRAKTLLQSIKAALGGEPGGVYQGEAAEQIKSLEDYLSTQQGGFENSLPKSRLLIEGGIVELPSAGYLPVTPGTAFTVNEQVKRLLGEGLDYRFCVVRPDYVPHALETAQHMDRISLLHGLDFPNDKPEVDILVPDGKIVSLAEKDDLLLFRTAVTLDPSLFDSNSNGTGGTTTGEGTVFDIKGATRLTGLPGGGGALYVAGTLESPFVRTRSPLPPSTPTNTAVASAGVSPMSVGPWGNLLKTTRRTSKDASASSGTGEAAAKAEAVANPASDLRIDGLASASLARGAATISGWASVRVEADPFTAAAGTVIPVSGQARAAGAQSGQTGTITAQVSGTMTILATSHVSSSQWDVSARLEVFAKFASSDSGGSTGSGGSSTPDLQQVILHAEVRLVGAADGGTAKVVLSVDKTSSVSFTAQWLGDPLKIVVTGVTTDDGTTTPLGRVTLLRDKDLLAPSNLWHGVAVHAIQAIGVGFQDPLFSETAGKLLFPEPPSLGSEVLVQATKDWVLFHRRRTHTCAYEIETVPLPPRRYQVYVIDQATIERNPPTAQEVLDVLLSGDEERLRGVQQRYPPFLAEFQGGKATLITAESELLSAWRTKASQGAEVLLSAIATKSAVDAASLELGRLLRFEQVVASVSPTTGGTIAHVLDDVPSALDVPGSDGIVVFYVGRAQVTEGHSVYATQFANIKELGSLSSPSFISALSTDRLLGGVGFVAGTGTAVQAELDAVAAKWSSWRTGAPFDLNERETLLGVYAQTTPAALEQERAANIAKSLGVSANPNPVLAITTLPASAPRSVVTVLGTLVSYTNFYLVDARQFGEIVSAILNNEFNPARDELIALDTLIRFKNNVPIGADVAALAAEVISRASPAGAVRDYPILGLGTSGIFARDDERLRLLGDGLVAQGLLNGRQTSLQVNDAQVGVLRRPGAQHVGFIFRMVLPS